LPINFAGKIKGRRKRLRELGEKIKPCFQKFILNSKKISKHSNIIVLV
jgi:hypothetical protein